MFVTIEVTSCNVKFLQLLTKIRISWNQGEIRWYPVTRIRNLIVFLYLQLLAL
jgi:hypothetical protein